ncbi:P-loop containing nucleoside triphosphate hydrolase protein [Naematelia encephala]|uniref:p-loop containing nucleoside triphosphate hydrolase protein n=1 Tax=Naematelia encephala TaxID=71784 RepID=A0A1Y2AK22_9TREE|nr:P-loop containing nucleoside triphosphate hydrolase protein [Naematelia encephala]
MPTPTHIVATAQQSRFDTALVDPTSIAELDLATVSISAGLKEILIDATIKLKDGLRYALIGPNGSGKSTILQAIAERLIPGVPESLRITLIGQTQSNPQDTSASGGDRPPDKDDSVLNQVLNGHVERAVALAEHDTLTQAIEAHDPNEGCKLFRKVQLERKRRELDVARRIAARRSGTRGKKAREEEIKAEQAFARAEHAQVVSFANSLFLLTCSSLLTEEIEPNWAVEATEMLAEAQVTLDVLESSTLETAARRILRGLGFSTGRIEGPVSALSGGWKSRMALAVGLLVPCDLLMLDEPSNFMDLESLKFLEDYLLASPQTIVITSHDQAFLDVVTERTIVLRRQSLLYFDGTPSSMQDAERKKWLGKEKQQAALDKKKEHIQASISEGRKAAKQTGDENRQRMVKSRQKKLDERWGEERSAKGTRFKLNRDMPGYHFTNRDAIALEQPEPPVVIKLRQPEPLRTKGTLLHLDEVGFRYKGAGKEVLRGVSMTLDQGGRCVLVGRNGQGKTTLARIVVGELPPTSGKIQRHPLMSIGYFTQHSADELVKYSDSTPLQWLMETVGQMSESDARGYLGHWGLPGRSASHTPIALLSGGQRVRLALSRLMYKAPDLLVLDEITTHLDAATIRALALALRTYSGGLMLITHDRWFSKVIVEGLAVDDDEADGIDARTGQTLLVDKGGVRIAAGGMGEYEKIAADRARKRAGHS